MMTQSEFMNEVAVKSHSKTTQRAMFLTGLYTVVVLLAVACTYLNQDTLRGLFGPPAVAMTESYDSDPDGQDVDHSVFDKLLQKHVNADGWVDYQALNSNIKPLNNYIESLAMVSVDQLGRDQRLALFINAYNAFTLQLILDNYPIASIKDIPNDKRWDAVRWNLGGQKYSLNQIEHEQIRPHFKEPRIHFALVCAAVGCPPLRDEAYIADRLEAQLESQSRYVHSHDRWLRYDVRQPGHEVEEIYLTSLYNWYGGDFEQSAGSVLEYVSQYVSVLRQTMDQGRRPSIHWLDYDWSLNSIENAP